MKITDVLGQLNVRFASEGESKHVRHGWVGLVCPWCDRGQGNYGLGVSLDRGACFCWKCGKRSLSEALHLITGSPYGHIKELLGGFSPTLVEKVPQGRLQIPEGVAPMLWQHKQYLHKRGFDPDEIAEVWGVQGIGFAPKMSWRLFIPIYVNERMVSWTTRTIAPECPVRYRAAEVTQESISRRNLLYGPPRASNRYPNTCVVTEGPTDAWAIGVGAVATLGIAYSSEQVRLITSYPVRIVIFDNEPEAQKRAMRLCESLEVMPGETYRVELSGDDPASSPKKEIRELRKWFLD